MFNEKNNKYFIKSQYYFALMYQMIKKCISYKNTKTYKKMKNQNRITMNSFDLLVVCIHCIRKKTYTLKTIKKFTKFRKIFSPIIQYATTANSGSYRSTYSLNDTCVRRFSCEIRKNHPRFYTDQAEKKEPGGTHTMNPNTDAGIGFSRLKLHACNARAHAAAATG